MGDFRVKLSDESESAVRDYAETKGVPVGEAADMLIATAKSRLDALARYAQNKAADREPKPPGKPKKPKKVAEKPKKVAKKVAEKPKKVAKKAAEESPKKKKKKVKAPRAAKPIPVVAEEDGIEPDGDADIEIDESDLDAHEM